jgi:NADPH:quinone reductase-like Zn-dependent oxidoreductase
VTGSGEAFGIESDLSDAELASFPCAYSTAENMLQRAGVVKGERVFVTGASGGVGSAAVQLARRRGAHIVAICSAAKFEQVGALGAEQLVDRDRDPLEALGKDSIDVVVDLVAGGGWPALPNILRAGGRYVSAGAIAGPIVEFDVRTLYLKDLTFYGCTYQDTQVFDNLVGYIERGEIRPLLSKVYPLAEIAAAQQDFLDKKFTGKLVLEIPA